MLNKAGVMAFLLILAGCGGGGDNKDAADEFYVWSGSQTDAVVWDVDRQKFAARKQDDQVVSLDSNAALPGLKVSANGIVTYNGTRVGSVGLAPTGSGQVAVFNCNDGTYMDIIGTAASYAITCVNFTSVTPPPNGGGSGGGNGATGESANQCVSVQRPAGRNWAQMTNVCSFAIAVYWCYANLDCSNGSWGLTSTTTIQPGQTKDATTFGNNAAQYGLVYAACKGANSYYRELTSTSGQCIL